MCQRRCRKQTVDSRQWPSCSTHQLSPSNRDRTIDRQDATCKKNGEVSLHPIEQRLSTGQISNALNAFLNLAQGQDTQIQSDRRPFSKP